MNPDKQRDNLIYLAGLLDADGYFGICLRTYRYYKGKKIPSIEMFASMGLKQVVPYGPRLLKSTFAGCTFMGKPQTERGQVLYCWRATHSQAGRAIERLLPFLRIKRQQAKLGLLLYQHATRRYATRRNRSVTPEEMAYRVDLYRRCRALNDVRGDVEERVNTALLHVAAVSEQRETTVSTGEAADRLNVSIRHIQYEVEKGRIPAQFINGEYRIDVADLEPLQGH